MRRRVAVAFVVLLVIGSLSAVWLNASQARGRRAQIVNQARAVASALDHTQLAALAQAPPAPSSPQYRRLQRNLTCLVDKMPRSRFVSILAIRGDGHCEFLVGSEGHGPQNEARRQQIHAEIAADVRRLLANGASRTVVLDQAHAESLVCVIAPVSAPGTDGLPMFVAVGFAVEADESGLAASALPPALFTAAAILLLLAGAVALQRRALRRDEPSYAWSHLEHALSIVVVGSLLSVSLFWISRDVEQHKRHQLFWELASERVEAIDRVLRIAQGVKLEALARFYAASEYVNQREFLDFTHFLLAEPLVESWQWIQPVAAAQRDAFEAVGRAEGLADFAVWQRDEQGGRTASTGRSTYYPVTRVAPYPDRGDELGFDLGSEPRQVAALAEAMQSGLPVFTDAPAATVRDTALPRAAIYRPVFADAQSGRVLGFAAAILPLRYVLDYVQLNDAAVLSIAHGRIGEPPRPLATTWNGRDPLHRDFAAVQPVLAFGETFFVEARASREFDRLYPIQTTILVLVAGLALTALLASLNGYYFQRRVRLEWLVQERTAELAVAEHHTELAIRGADLGTWDWNVATGEVALNERWAEMLGLPAAELPRRVEDWLSRLEPQQRATVERGLADLRAGRAAAYEAEVRLTHRSGDPVWVLVRGRTIQQLPDGRPARICGTGLDITPRIIAEQERRRLEDQLQQTQRTEAIGRLAGGVAHDLNNLLSPIIGYGELLREDLPPQDQKRQYADAVLRAALRARELIAQLLAYGRKQALDIKPTDLDGIIAEFAPLMRKAVQENVAIRFAPAPRPCAVLADARQIEQVLMNLVVNAAQAMPDGGTLTIETAQRALDARDVAAYPDLRPGRYAILTVRDTGIGMDQTTRERAFEPFFSTKGDKGTGMGLATVYGVVKQHGGSVWFDSEPGRGTTFEIALPAASETAQRTSGEHAGAADVSGTETILLVEDQEEVRQLADSILSRLGYKVLCAASGREALAVARAREEAIDLLLTDVVMPEMNGRELFQEMVERYPDLAVLYMSGYTNDVIANRGILDDGVEFIQKPFSVEMLAQRVRAVIDARRRPR